VSVAANVGCIERCIITRGGTAGCEPERDRGVCGGDLVVVVEVAFLRRGGPWMQVCVSSADRQREAVDIVAAEDVVLTIRR